MAALDINEVLAEFAGHLAEAAKRGDVHCEEFSPRFENPCRWQGPNGPLIDAEAMTIKIVLRATTSGALRAVMRKTFEEVPCDRVDPA